jgi:hypothetical protein
VQATRQSNAEYLEMPGLRCQMVLDVLVQEKFLHATPDGHYARLSTGHHPHRAKADLRIDERAKKAS